jgi:hypothetical protein
LTERELEVMHIFWRHGEATAAEARGHTSCTEFDSHLIYGKGQQRVLEGQHLAKLLSHFFGLALRVVNRRNTAPLRLLASLSRACKTQMLGSKPIPQK